MFWPKLLSWMKKLLMSTSFWGIFLLIVVWLVRHFALPWLSPPPPARLQKARPADPAALLSGPAAFTLLALVILTEYKCKTAYCSTIHGFARNGDCAPHYV